MHHRGGGGGGGRRSSSGEQLACVCNGDLQIKNVKRRKITWMFKVERWNSWFISTVLSLHMKKGCMYIYICIYIYMYRYVTLSLTSCSLKPKTVFIQTMCLQRCAAGQQQLWLLDGLQFGMAEAAAGKRARLHGGYALTLPRMGCVTACRIHTNSFLQS